MTALLHLPVVSTIKHNFLCHYLGKYVLNVQQNEILPLAFDNPMGSGSQSKIWIITIFQIKQLNGVSQGEAVKL